MKAITLHYRESLAEAIERSTDSPILGAEVGVWSGETSLFLLNRYPGLTLYSVDPWETRGKEETWRSTERPMGKIRRLRMAFEEAAARFGPRSRILACTGREGSERVANGMLDFVFIDDDHRGKTIEENLGCWWPKIRPGGAFCGHDYGYKKYPAVTLAVDAFADKVGCRVGTLPGLVWTWIKPRERMCVTR